MYSVKEITQTISIPVIEKKSIYLDRGQSLVWLT